MRNEIKDKNNTEQVFLSDDSRTQSKLMLLGHSFTYAIATGEKEAAKAIIANAREIKKEGDKNEK